eukprot:CAMPEP_0174934660 /NCGR_PEP_ID=MMETSP1355-20121228/50533_1 /TAXON_ID=464990 /ORGANISM="Hemiselmis tepida, Strain CCMP443" /LENGTH=104 /DNA_ID=CAMNT_0016181291 /DNA_START=466 /DNA_END=780 /DNA_ORIENTATION=+
MGVGAKRVRESEGLAASSTWYGVSQPLDRTHRVVIDPLGYDGGLCTVVHPHASSPGPATFLVARSHLLTSNLGGPISAEGALKDGPPGVLKPSFAARKRACAGE